MKKGNQNKLNKKISDIFCKILEVRVYISKYINYKVKDDLDEIKNTKWVSEFIKTFIIFLISVIILYAVRLISPGNYKALKLEKYLNGEIIKYLDIKELESRILFNGQYDILSEDNVILLYSEYETTSEEKPSGRCLSIFERAEGNILHDIFGINPSYKLVFCGVYEGIADCLYYDDFQNDDLDQDGKMEFMLFTKSRFASRVSNELILIAKNQNGWLILSPNMLKVRDKLCSITDKDIQFSGVNPYNLEEDKNKDKLYISTDIFRFYNILTENEFYDVVGVKRESYFLENPLNSTFNICYSFTCKYPESFDEDYLYTMQQFNDKKLFTDPNWNMGEPLYLYDDVDFWNKCDSYWGIQTDSMIFYANPDEEVE